MAARTNHGTGLCRHCKRCPNWRPRGLCCVCFDTPDIRRLYPVGSANPATATAASRGLGLGNVNLPLSRKPTAARPGSHEKKMVMKRRALLGLAIFHPDDAQF